MSREMIDLCETKLLNDNDLFLIQDTDGVNKKMTLESLANSLQQKLGIQFNCRNCGAPIKDINIGCGYCV